MKVYQYVSKKTGKPVEPFGVCTSCDKKDIPCPTSHDLKLVAHENCNLPCTYCLPETMEVNHRGRTTGFAK